MGNLLSVVRISTSSNNNLHKLDNLPELVYHYLFKYLDLDDVFELRLLSKPFYFIIKHYHESIKQLSFYDYEKEYFYWSYRDNWFSTNKSIRLRNQLNVPKLGLLINPTNNFIKLEYLRIIIKYSIKTFEMKHLNKFTKLTILMIDGMDINHNGDLLQLPDLKALSIKIRHPFNKFYSLIIDCPNLRSLHVAEYSHQLTFEDLIELKHPLKIKHLKLEVPVKNILMFRNLECLEFVNKFYQETNHLSILYNLKKLKIVSPAFEDLRKLVDLFKCNKRSLEFVVHGVKVKDIKKLDEYREKPKLEFQLNNYSELDDDLNFVSIMNYNDLIRLFPNNQPSDLFDNYSNIQFICTYKGVEDENRLINFIKKCPNLNYLDIREPTFNQQFYDRLPSICFLCRLEISKSDINLNYGFLTKMTYLVEFSTDQDAVSDNLNLNHLKYLKEFYLIIQGKKIKIDKDGKNRYKVYVDYVLSIKEYSSLDKIIEYLNSLRDQKLALML